MSEETEMTNASPADALRPDDRHGQIPRPAGTYPAGGATPGANAAEPPPTMGSLGGDEEPVTIIPPIEDTRPGETLTEPGKEDLMDEIVPPPSLGRIVHYVMPNGERRPAVVIEDPTGLVVSLNVFHARHDPLPGGHYQTAHWDPNGAPGTWHWPPRR